MKLRTLPKNLSLRGKRVLIRVDWNVPLKSGVMPEDSLKIERSLKTLDGLVRRGAIVIILTHLGRPKGREKNFSTQGLVSLLKRDYHRVIQFHPESISRTADRERLQRDLSTARPGSLHLLENVRFEKGEETNDKKLARAYAELGDLFINDAFASSHRAHTSVLGLMRELPSYAGPALAFEVSVLIRLLQKPKYPFFAFVGGLKFSTKIPIVKVLLKLCDRVYVGGAMAMSIFALRGYQVGRTPIEVLDPKKDRKLFQSSRLFLPHDVIVTTRLAKHTRSRSAEVGDVQPNEYAVDIGPQTLAIWKRDIQTAQTILWNGPEGVVEIPPFARGTQMLARAIALRSRGRAFGVAGGGDTLPVILSTRGAEGFDFLSTGGGALLEFLIKKGALPGLVPLIVK